MAKGCLLVLLAAAIRQERWLYMTSDSSTLNVVDDFEEASRGPWGSIIMLTTARGTYVKFYSMKKHSLTDSSVRAFLLAAVMVLAFGFEPFLQQLVALESRNVPVSNLGLASIKTPTSYDASLARVGNATGGSQLVLAASIGAYGGATGAVPQPQCATGNCTWPDYNVLAMCSVCQDVTDRVTIDGNAFSNGTNFNDVISDYAQNANSSTSQSYTYNATIRVPNGNAPSIDFPLSLSGSDPVTWDLTRPKRYTWSLNIDPTPNSYWASSWKNGSFAGIDSPMYAMGYLDMDLNEDHSRMVLKQALECALTPCVRTEHTEMKSYVLDPDVTHTQYGHIEFGESQPDGTVTSGFRASVNGTDFAMVDRGTGNYDGSANDFIRSLRIVLEGNSTYTRQGNYYGDGDENNFDYEATGFTQTSSPWSSIGQQAIDGSGNFTDIADGVARAVSGKLQDLQDTALNGTVLRSEIIVNVRWGWLAFPLSLVLLGVGGLVATILATRQRHLPIWKDSVLPLLLRHGRKMGSVAQCPEVAGESPNAASAITREARLEQVQLVPTRASAQQAVPVWMLESISSEKELQPTRTDTIGMAR